MPKFQYRGRRSIRLQNYDYTRDGAYFVTLCTHQRQCLFGNVQIDRVRPSHLGAVAQQYWQEIPQHFPFVHIDEFVVMPNHLHGILWLKQTESIIPLTPNFTVGKHSKALGTAIGSYKAAVTNKIRELCQTSDLKIWQRNYYEVIIREETQLYNYRKYIQQNPLKWHLDEDNPQNIHSFQGEEYIIPL